MQQEEKVLIILHEDRWVLDADIENFFENIEQGFLLKKVFLPSLGIISFVLVDLTMNSLENAMYESIYPLTRFNNKRIQIKGYKVAYPSHLKIVWYADDFIKLSRNKHRLEIFILTDLKQFLKERDSKIVFKKN